MRIICPYLDDRQDRNSYGCAVACKKGPVLTCELDYIYIEEFLCLSIHLKNTWP